MNKTLRYYLAAYNLVAFAFWAAYFVYFIATGFKIDVYSMLLLNIAQGLALFEILHAVLKWVKSPVGSTVAQVASRLLVVVLIDNYVLVMIARGMAFIEPTGPPKVPVNSFSVTDIGIIIISFAWCITELVRYSLYFLSQFNKQPKWLLWMRYSFFIGLYPLGVIGEWVIIVAALWVGGFNVIAYSCFLGVLFLAYSYGFPVLYRYMWRQRKAKLG
jgi:very-long-chain (3R)-3-hydroxyacyl-CoA dehydratase